MKYTVMDAAPKVKEHDIVQIIPEHEWSGALVIVTVVKEWGIEGFVQIPLKGPAYIRIEHSDFKIVGQCAFVPAYK